VGGGRKSESRKNNVQKRLRKKETKQIMLLHVYMNGQCLNWYVGKDPILKTKKKEKKKKTPNMADKLSEAVCRSLS
jgi:hypothetical protein